MDDSHRDGSVRCASCKKTKSYSSAKQVRAHMLQCIRFHGYPTICPNIEGEGASDQVNNKAMQQTTFAKTILTHENPLERSHNQPVQQPDVPSTTLRNIITTAAVGKGDRIIAVRDVLDKKLSEFVARKIENILTNETSLKTERKTVKNFVNYTKADNPKDNLNKGEYKSESDVDDDVDDVSNCQVSTESSELQQSKAQTVSCDGVNMGCSGQNEGSLSEVGQSVSAFAGGQNTFQSAEISGIFPEKRMATYAQAQTRYTFTHQTQLCRSCGKIYSDGNFYTIEPEDLCDCLYQFFCKLCHTSYRRVTELRQHLANNHTFHRCLCGVPFANASLLELHREHGMCPVEIIPLNRVTLS